MMNKIDREKVVEAVFDKIDSLKNVSEAERTSLEIYQKAYQKAKNNPPKDIIGKLDNYTDIGIPLENKWEFSFGKTFETRKEMRNWARQILEGEAIAGVDGSQAPADKIISIPIALVRAVGFVNKHDSDYRRLEKYRCLTSEDSHFESTDYLRLNNLEINYARFDLENEIALKSLQENPSLILIDNTFILSYLLFTKTGEYFKLHLDSLLQLLNQVEGKSMIAGVVDPSQSKEISTTLSNAYEIKENPVHDSSLLYQNLDLFDRSCVYRSKRKVLSRYQTTYKGNKIDYSDGIGFFYLRTHSHRPMKIEFPLWIHEEGLVDELADLIRGSCVIGEGYPYELSKAHEHVIISKKEKEKFYEIVQKIAQREGIDYSISQKEFKKRRPVR